MDLTRREFAGLVGTLAATWELAVAEFAQTGEVSADTVATLLDAQGKRGIYAHPERFEELRAAMARTIRVQKVLRAFPIPEDVEPAIVFRRG